MEKTHASVKLMLSETVSSAVSVLAVPPVGRKTGQPMKSINLNNVSFCCRNPLNHYTAPSYLKKNKHGRCRNGVLMRSRSDHVVLLYSSMASNEWGAFLSLTRYTKNVG